MVYRTKTYIAADWDGDKDTVQQLHKWNESKKWSLSFTDAHELTQARDSSLNCNIKTSLNTRLKATKTFILIVGSNTKTVRSGGCQYCKSYNSLSKNCLRGYYIDYSSYIEYECDKAIQTALEGKMRIVIMYKAAKVDRSKCPESIKNHGKHIALYYLENGKYYWNYQAVKDAIG